MRSVKVYLLLKPLFQSNNTNKQNEIYFIKCMIWECLGKSYENLRFVREWFTFFSSLLRLGQKLGNTLEIKTMNENETHCQTFHRHRFSLTSEIGVKNPFKCCPLVPIDFLLMWNFPNILTWTLDVGPSMCNETLSTQSWCIANYIPIPSIKKSFISKQFI